MMEGKMKKTLIIAVLICMSLGFAAGCYQTGEVAGKTVKGMEDGVKDMQKGYEHGKSDKSN
jgi:hypothetical protein